jgi:chemotaxis protein MotB
MSKKKHEEEHENHERWLVSYADFITLLFAFFVVMYSVSRVDNKRLVQAANSIKWAMHFAGTGGVNQMPIFDQPASSRNLIEMTPPQSMPSTRELIENLRARLQAKIRPFLLQRGLQAVTITADLKRVNVRLAAADFFDPGKAALRPQILPVLDAIAEEIVPLGRPIRVEGHTDDTPVAGTRFHDNWELSADRAATVASYLERAHHAPARLLTASGFAASRPIAFGGTPEDREINRRVELAVELDYEATPPRPRAAAAPPPPGAGAAPIAPAEGGSGGHAAERGGEHGR